MVHRDYRWEAYNWGTLIRHRHEVLSNIGEQSAVEEGLARGDAVQHNLHYGDDGSELV